MKILDRYVLNTFLKNYLLSFMILVGLYVILDMLFNFDELMAVSGKDAAGTGASVLSLIHTIADYYFYQMFLIFVLTRGYYRPYHFRRFLNEPPVGEALPTFKKKPVWGFEIHEWAKWKFLPPRFVTVNGEETRIAGTTKSLGKAEFGDYLDKISAETGVPLPDMEAAGFISNYEPIKKAA